jgi:hypothetical protein
MPSLDPTMLDQLLTMMYNINPYVEVFKMARDMMATKGAPTNLKITFHCLSYKGCPPIQCADGQ